MPAPITLFEVFASGVGGSDPADDPRWEWTTTHHVTYSTPDDPLDTVVSRLRSWWLGRVAFQAFGVGTTWAANTWLTRFKVVQVLTSALDELEDFTIACGIGAGASDSVSPQVALLTWAKTNVLGVESRLYLPGQTRDSLEQDPQRWKTTVYSSRISALWSTAVVAGTTIKPVIWSPMRDEVFPITEAKYTRWPRTQRRRGLSLREFEITLPVT